MKGAQYSSNLQYEFMPGYSGVISDDPMDMRNKGYVQVVGDDVSVFASGFRNPFGIAMCASDQTVFVTDNGPNKGFGPTMFGPE